MPKPDCQNCDYEKLVTQIVRGGEPQISEMRVVEATTDENEVVMVPEKDLGTRRRELQEKLKEEDENFRGYFNRFLEVYQSEHEEMSESERLDVAEQFQDFLASVGVVKARELFRSFHNRARDDETNDEVAWTGALLTAWQILRESGLDWESVPEEATKDLFARAATVGSNPGLWEYVAAPEQQVGSDPNDRRPVTRNVARLRRVRRQLDKAADLEYNQAAIWEQLPLQDPEEMDEEQSEISWANYDFESGEEEKIRTAIAHLDDEGQAWLKGALTDTAHFGAIMVESLVSMAAMIPVSGTVRMSNHPLEQARRIINGEFATVEEAIRAAYETWTPEQKRVLEPNGLELYLNYRVHYPIDAFASLLEKMRYANAFATQELQLFPINTREDLDFKLTVLHQDMVTLDRAGELARRLDITRLRDFMLRYHRSVDAEGFADWNQDLAWAAEAHKVSDQELRDIIDSIETREQAERLGDLLARLQRREGEENIGSFAELEKRVNG